MYGNVWKWGGWWAVSDLHSWSKTKACPGVSLQALRD